MAPMHDGPLTQMGMQLVAEEFKMDCALLVEVDDAALQEIPQDRMMLEEKQNKTHPELTEHQEVGGRAGALRIAV